ncbi:MAG: hypothetical protein HXX16_13685 [Bacteroidales bacterium]|nr:hypothetical protein [Bacteroidales bacterium]
MKLKYISLAILLIAILVIPLSLKTHSHPLAKKSHFAISSINKTTGKNDAYSLPCYVTGISASEISFGAQNPSSQSVDVYTENGCINWQYTVNDSWIHATKSGSTLTITVDSNTGTQRPGSITFIGDGSNTILTVNQQNGCSIPYVGSISGSTTVCKGSNGISYSVVPVAGANGYIWTLPTGATIASGSGTSSITVNYSSSAESGSIHVYAYSNCGNGPQSNLLIAVNDVPSTPEAISGTSPVCNGTSGNYSIANVTGATSYNWSVTGGSVTSSQGTSATIAFTSAGTSTISVTAGNSCGNSSASTRSITVNALPTPTISGSASVCTGSAGNTYTTQTGMTAYNWTVTGGTVTAGGTATSNSVTISWGAAGTGHVKVNYTNTNGCTAAAQTDMSVTINPLPAPTISGPANVCSGSTGNIYTTQTGMTAYSWTVTGGTITAGGTNTSSSVTVTWGAAGTGHVKVNYTNANGCTAAAQTDISVIINALPTPTISGSASTCTGSTGNIYTTQVGMTNYSWTVIGGTITAGGTSTSTSVTVTWGATGTGHVKVNYTNASGCTAPSQVDKSVTINALPTPTISGPTSACVGSTGNTYTTQTGMTAYSWTLTGGAITAGGTTTSSSVTVTWGAAGTGHVKVNYTNTNGCTAAAQTDMSVTINSAPAIATNGQPQSVQVAEGGTAAFSVTTTGTGITYKWQVYTVNSGIWADIANATGSSYTFTTTYSQNGNQYHCVVSGTCTPSVTSSSATLTVNSNPNKVSIIYIPLIKDYAYNFVQEIQPQVKLQSSRLDSLLQGKIATLKVGDVNQSISYFDGLGRPLQTLGYRASPSGNDIIQPIAYDNMGREKLKYLPYSGGYDGKFKPNALGSSGSYSTSDHLSFYQNTTQTDLPTAEPNPYSDAVFEPSPLNRVLEQGAPGSTWQPTNQTGSSNGHTQRMVYCANGQYEVLQLTSDTTGLLTNSTGELSGSLRCYPANQLYKTIVKSENWQATDGSLNTTEEFKDKQGQVILKRTFVKNSLGATIPVSTYYIYDDLNLLRYVIPPAAVDIITFPANRDNSVIKNLCYYYRYDGRKRMTEKQLPGADPVYMVYDKRDRLALTQDGNMRPNKEWLFTKYDAFNRPVMTGVYTHNSTATQTQMQVFVDALYSPIPPATARPYFVTRNNIGETGYSDESFPVTSDGITEYLSVTYYDNYGFPSVLPFYDANGMNISGYSDGEGVDTRYFEGLKGQVTGSRTKVLNSSIWLTTTNYYDNKYRVIQSRSDLYDGSNGGKETTSTLYDFSGKVRQSKLRQELNGTSTTVAKYLTYDHASRLLKVEQEIDGANRTTLSELTYNELGQLQQKKLGGNIQSVDYKYNIRGWLTKINDPENLGADLFGMKLLYNDTDVSLGSTAQFNGNISATVWNTQGKKKRAYSYAYDELSRLVSSNHKVYSTTWGDSTSYEEKNISYDKNGNITHLLRTNQTGGTLNDFTYTYSETNQLKHLNVGGNYIYDSNGNMTTDGLKGFSVEYNPLNLPKKVSKGTDNISYIYTAAGAKLAKLQNGTLKQLYAGSLVYNSSKLLDYILNDEGMVVKQGGGFEYQYFMKDHLGNTRAVFKDSLGIAKIKQVADYYPFGSRFVPFNPESSNKYLYNGKELQDDMISGTQLNWLDYGARFYDPVTCRWMVVDPLAEKYRRWTPYNYGVDNPLRFIDPDGNGILDMIAGAVVGVVTDLGLANIGPVPNPTGGIALREAVGNMVSNPDDYNKTLESTDCVMIAAGESMEVTGGVMTADGLATAEASEATLITSAGTTAEVTVPTYATGLVYAGIGTTTTAAGAVITTTTTLNMSAGYNYGRAGTTIAKENGVTIKTHGTNDAHKPAHAHVEGEGQTTRIGPKGKPLKDQPSLTTKQNKVVQKYQKEIRKEVNKIGRANKKLEGQK